MSLKDIPIITGEGIEAQHGQASGNIPLLLNELRHALIRLAGSGETTTIDLRSLPLAPGELDTLQQRLGQGEVSARVDALGPTEIVETRYAGIWRVIHYNSNDEIVGYFLEVTTLPALLRTPEDALQVAIDQLTDTLN